MRQDGVSPLQLVFDRYHGVVSGREGLVRRWRSGAALLQRSRAVLRPIMRLLFPDVPPEHPAMGSMVEPFRLTARSRHCIYTTSACAQCAIWRPLIHDRRGDQCVCTFLHQTTLCSYSTTASHLALSRLDRQDQPQLSALLCSRRFAHRACNHFRKTPGEIAGFSDFARQFSHSRDARRNFRPGGSRLCLSDEFRSTTDPPLQRQRPTPCRTGDRCRWGFDFA